MIILHQIVPNVKYMMHTQNRRAYTMRMNIRDLINEQRVEVGAELYAKDEALEKLIQMQKKSGAIHNPRAVRRELQEREQRGSTAISCRIAIIDFSHSGAAYTAVSALTVKNGVDYCAPDKRPVKILFMITGKSGSQEHIEVKARLMHLLMDSEFTARLTCAKSKEEFLTLLADREKVRYSPPLPNKKYDCSRFLR